METAAESAPIFVQAGEPFYLPVSHLVNLGGLLYGGKNVPSDRHVAASPVKAGLLGKSDKERASSRGAQRL